MWREATDMPKYSDFVWIIRQSETDPCMAYLNHTSENKRCVFQDPYTVGDAEGLVTEYFTDVLLWRDIDTPLNRKDER